MTLNEKQKAWEVAHITYTNITRCKYRHKPIYFKLGKVCATCIREFGVFTSEKVKEAYFSMAFHPKDAVKAKRYLAVLESERIRLAGLVCRQYELYPEDVSTVDRLVEQLRLARSMS